MDGDPYPYDHEILSSFVDFFFPSKTAMVRSPSFGFCSLSATGALLSTRGYRFELPVLATQVNITGEMCLTSDPENEAKQDICVRQEFASLQAKIDSQAATIAQNRDLIAEQSTMFAEQANVISQQNNTIAERANIIARQQKDLDHISVTLDQYGASIAALQAAANSSSDQSSSQADVSSCGCCTALNSSLRSTDMRAGALEQRVSDLEQLTPNSSALVSAVQSNEAGIALLKSESANLTAMLERQTPISESLTSMIAANFSNVAQTVAALAVASQTQSDEIAAMQSTQQSQAATLTDANLKVSNLTARIEAVEHLSLGSSALVNTVYALQAANVSVQVAAAQLSVTVTSLSTQVDSLQAASSSQAVQITALQDANNTVEASLSFISTQLASHDFHIASLQAANVSLQSSAVALSQRVTAVEGSLTSISARLSSAESLSAGSSALVNVVIQLQIANSTVQLAISQLNSTVASHTALISNLQSGQTSQSSQITALQVANATIQSQYGALTLRVTTLEANVSSLNARLSAAESLKTGSSALVNAVLNLQSSSSVMSSSSSLVSIYSVSAVAGSSSATVSWSLASFTVLASPGGAQCVSVGGSSCSIAGLINGVSYKFNVTATNSAGVGPTSGYSNVVIPTAPELASGNFTGNAANAGGISARTLFNPIGLALASNRDFFIVDYGNNRVLQFSALNTTAKQVYGQGGNFSSNVINFPSGSITAATAEGFNNPAGVTLDVNNNIYLSDWKNSRVLYIPAGSTLPTRVYGQGGSFTSNLLNFPSGIPSASNLGYSWSTFVDSNNGLYIGDLINSRVLYYNSSSTVASRVWGQGGLFDSRVVNYPDGLIGVASASSLRAPTMGILDNSGGLYIVDCGNNRALFFLNGSTIASRVYGMGGNFSATSLNTGGISADSLYLPETIALDSAGIYLSDTGNNRVLYFLGNSTTASRVYGQGGDFTTSDPNKGGVSASSLNLPGALIYDSISAGLYVSDFGNHRVLFFPAGSTTATRVYGQPLLSN
jgi:hypothetical protein